MPKTADFILDWLRQWWVLDRAGAIGHAKLTGELGCCLATSGGGPIHLLNGSCDAKLDHQPVGARSRRWTSSPSRLASRCVTSSKNGG